MSITPFPNGHGTPRPTSSHRPNGGHAGAGGGPMPITPAVLASASPIACDACGFDLFMPMVMQRRISQVASPTGSEVVVELPVKACGRCGHVNESALPPGLERPEIPEVDFGAADDVGENGQADTRRQ